MTENVRNLFVGMNWYWLTAALFALKAIRIGAKSVPLRKKPMSEKLYKVICAGWAVLAATIVELQLIHDSWNGILEWCGREGFEAEASAAMLIMMVSMGYGYVLYVLGCWGRKVAESNRRMFERKQERRRRNMKRKMREEILQEQAVEQNQARMPLSSYELDQMSTHGQEEYSGRYTITVTSSNNRRNRRRLG